MRLLNSLFLTEDEKVFKRSAKAIKKELYMLTGLKKSGFRTEKNDEEMVACEEALKMLQTIQVPIGERIINLILGYPVLKDNLLSLFRSDYPKEENPDKN